MGTILAFHGSPRAGGNTSSLLDEAVRGAREEGASVQEITLKDLRISPCLELYGCKKDGRCVIRDDFQEIHEKLLECAGIILASPIFFYTVSAHTKILMDRCQSFWVRKYWLQERESTGMKRRGLFISAGATGGKRLFEGVLLTVRYFFDAIDTELWKSLLYRGLDERGDVRKHPDYLDECYRAGRGLVQALESGKSL